MYKHGRKKLVTTFRLFYVLKNTRSIILDFDHFHFKDFHRQLVPATDDVFKIAHAVIYHCFYPESYLIEENNQLIDQYTIGNLTVYTIVLFAPIAIEAQSCLQWSA